MGLVQTVAGYVMRYAGGLTVAGTLYRALTDTMLPEEYIGGALAGGVLYIMGDCVARREIAQQELRVHEELLNVQKRQASLLEHIADHGVVQPDLSDRK